MGSSKRNYSDSFIRMNINSLEKPLISIIIVNYNGLEYTRNAVRSILRYSPQSEIIVIDNGSTDGSPESLAREFPEIKLKVMTENRGFGYGNNRGVEQASGKFLFFLNNDTYLVEDTPSRLASVLQEDATVGICGPKLLNRDGTFQLSFGLDPSIVNEWIVRRMHRRIKKRDAAYASELEMRYENKHVDWLTGASLMVRREAFEAVGGFDEAFFMYFEDADLCRRIRERGFAIRYLPSTSLIHLVGQSSERALSRTSGEYRKSQIHYYRKHLSVFSAGMLRLYLLCRNFNHGQLS